MGSEDVAEAAHGFVGSDFDVFDVGNDISWPEAH